MRDGGLIELHSVHASSLGPDDGDATIPPSSKWNRRMWAQVVAGMEHQSDPLIFCVRVRRRNFAKVALVTAVVSVFLIIVSTILGVVCDEAIFGVSGSFYTRAFALWSLLPASLFAIRVLLTAGCRGDSRYPAVWAIMCWASFFIAFHISAYTLLNVDFKLTYFEDNHAFRFRQTLLNLVDKDTLEGIESEDDFWDWWEGSLVPNLLTCSNIATTTTIPGGLKVKAADGSFCDIHSGKYHLWGETSMRTLRVKRRPCGMGMVDGSRDDFNGCLPSFTEEYIDREPIVLRDWPVPWFNQTLQNVSIPFTDGHFFNFQGNRVEGVATEGQFATYPASGQVHTFDPGGPIWLTYQRDIKDKMRESEYINNRTRLFAVEQVVQSFEIGVAALVVVLVEFGESGGVHGTVEVYLTGFPRITVGFELAEDANPWGWPRGACVTEYCKQVNSKLKYGNFGSQMRGFGQNYAPEPAADASKDYRENYESLQNLDEPRWRLYAGLPPVSQSYQRFLMLVGFCLYFLVEEVEELWERGWRKYIRKLWNIVDLGIVGFTMLAFFMDIKAKYQTPFLIDLLDDSSPKNGSDISVPSLYPTNQSLQQRDGYVAIVVVCLWARLMRYLNAIEKLAIVSRTMGLASKSLGALMIIFVIVIVAFSMAFNLIFGSKLEEFKNFNRAFYTLIVCVLGGDFDYDGIVGTGDNTGAVLAFFFVLFMVWIMLTMIIAIINEAFLEAVAQEETDSCSRSSAVKWLSQIEEPVAFGVVANLRIVIFNATDLPVGDRFEATSNPYVRLHVIKGSRGSETEAGRVTRRGQAFRTETQKQTTYPEWNERVALSCAEGDDRLLLRVFDADLAMTDAILGSAVVPLSRLKKDGTVHHLNLILRTTGKMRNGGNGGSADVATEVKNPLGEHAHVRAGGIGADGPDKARPWGGLQEPGSSGPPGDDIACGTLAVSLTMMSSLPQSQGPGSESVAASSPSRHRGASMHLTI